MNELLGNWKLEQYLMTELESGQVTEPFGSHPSGYLGFSADARMYAMIGFENRPRVEGMMAPDEDALRLHRSMLAYAGSYTVEGDQVKVAVDWSWNEAWTGTTQVRQVAVDGSRMTLSFLNTMPGIGKQMRFELRFSKVESA